MSAMSPASELEPFPRPRVGLALSGGGARGLAHIGVLDVLEQAAIPVHCLTGTSMGGLIAAAYAAGMSPSQIIQEAMDRGRWRRLLRLADPGLSGGGVLQGRRLLAYFESQFGQLTFADLHLPLALIAVDLNHRREVILRDGLVAMALRATVAIPGLLAPVIVGDQRLVDGGLLNSLPHDVARQMGADIVIAVDVQPEPGRAAGRWQWRRRRIPGGLAATLGALSDALEAMMAANQERKLRESPPDVLIRPQLPTTLSVFSGYNRVPELVAAGALATQAALPAIRRLVSGGY